MGQYIDMHPTRTRVRDNTYLLWMGGYFVLLIGGWTTIGTEQTLLWGVRLLVPLSTVRLAVLVAGRVRRRRVIRNLRALGIDHRRIVLRTAFTGLERMQLEISLSDEGQPERSGVVERFPFSRRDAFHTAVAFWAVVLAGGAGAGVGLLRFGADLRWVVWTPMWAAAVTLLWWLRRRASRLATVLEVSPFWIARVEPTGARRQLSWSQPLVLRNVPRAQAVEIRAPAGHVSLDVPYSLIGFARALDLILQYGAFRSDAPAR